MTSIKNEFIPFLISKLHSKSINQIIYDNSHENYLLSPKLSIQCKLTKNLTEYENTPLSDIFFKVSDFQKYFSIIDEIHKPYNEINLTFFATRNNAANYFLIYARKIEENLEQGKAFNYEIPELSAISIDSYIVNSPTIGKNCKLTKTIAGSSLVLKDGSKILNSIICDNVKIGENCQIINSIIGDNTIIGDNCVISDCVVVSDFTVQNDLKSSSKIIGGDINDEDDLLNYMNI